MSDGGPDEPTAGELPDDAEFQADYASADARAKEARNAALDALSMVDPDDPNTSKIDVLEAEEDAVTTWAKHAAMAREDGHAQATINAHGGAVASETEMYRKDDVLDLVDEQRDRLQSGGGGSGPPRLDDWIAANLERVVRLETTDETQDTLWRWDFDQGTLETASTKDGVTHFSWVHFRDEIYQGLGVNVTKPGRSENEEWRQWIADVIERHEEVHESFGPRSHAVERLQGFVGDSMAFGDKGDAVERNGVHLDTDPSNTDPDELRVQSSDVKRIADDVEVTVRALQQELDAQGFTHPDVNGVSEGEYVNGTMVRFWILDPDFADPAGYLDQAQSPASQAAQQGGSAGAAPSASGQAGQQGGGPNADGAKLSSIGPATDDAGDESDAEGDGAGADEAAQNDAQERTEDAKNAQDDDTDGGDGA